MLLPQAIDLDSIERELLKRKLEGSLLEFCKHIFREEYKKEFIFNWHHKLLCEVLEDVVNGKRRNLIINIPPRYSKTEIVVKLFIAWCIARDPSSLFMHLSYSDSLALDNSDAAREVVQSATFQGLWDVALSKTKDSKSYWSTRDRGGVFASSTGGKVTGMGCGHTGSGFKGCMLIDDPIKPEDAASDVVRKKMNERFNNTLSSRLNNPSETPIIVIMQRLHEDDLSGFLINENSEFDFDHINLPAICEVEQSYDPRSPGEALWPSKHNTDQLKTMEKKSSMTFAGQYQQRPAPAEGNLIKKDWLNFYDVLPNIEWKILVADLTFKKGELNDFACVEVWAKEGANIYLVDQIRDRMDFPEQLAAIRAMCKRHPRLRGKYIEEAANGAAIISTLRNEISGIVPIKPRTSKEARLQAVAHVYEGRNVFYPNPKHHKWVNININELISFPNATHDDTVDTATMAVSQITEKLAGIDRMRALGR